MGTKSAMAISHSANAFEFTPITGKMATLYTSKHRVSPIDTAIQLESKGLRPLTLSEALFIFPNDPIYVQMGKGESLFLAGGEVKEEGSRAVEGNGKISPANGASIERRVRFWPGKFSPLFGVNNDNTAASYNARYTVDGGNKLNKMATMVVGVKKGWSLNLGQHASPAADPSLEMEIAAVLERFIAFPESEEKRRIAGLLRRAIEEEGPTPIRSLVSTAPTVQAAH